MKFSGNNFLSLSYQTGISFNVDITLNDLRGNCDLGFTGENKNTNFKFNNGKIFDPENRLVYFYSTGEKINLSGNISPRNYSYYINNNLLCLNGTKSSFISSGYYVNTQNCSAESEFNIFGTQPAYEINLSPIFYIDNNSYLTGTINNSNNLNFKIYSGSITVPTGFLVQGISDYVSNTGSFSINHYSFSRNQVQDERLYEIQLNLFTNFGQITKNFTTTGSYSGYFNVNLNLNDVTDYYSRSGLQTGIGNYKQDNFSLNFNIVSGSIRTQPAYLNKYLYLKLEYSGGNTGNFDYNIFSTGLKTDTITGFLTGSGILEKQISFTGIGYNQLSGMNATGFITGIIKDTFFVTGFSSQNVTVLYSGYADNTFFTYNKNITITGTTTNGKIYYYKNLFNDSYPETDQISGQDVTTDNFFGYSIAMATGNLIIVGSPKSDIGSYPNAGAIYIFTGNNINYKQKSKITGSNSIAQQHFGTSVDVSDNGSYIFVGGSGMSIGNGITTFTGVGAVNIFTGNAGNNTWVQKKMITGSDASGFDCFGSCLKANSSNVLVIGAPYKNINSFASAGAVYIFTGNTNDWVQVSRITGNDAGANDNFGSSIDIANDFGQIIVGAPNDTLGSYSNAGSVYIFTGNNTNQWRQSIKITGLDTLANDNFGSAVAASSDGKIIAVSAVNKNSKAGNVYIFTGNGTNTWAQKQKLTPSDASAQDAFGYSIAMNSLGTKIFIGATGDEHTPYIDAGSIYVFTGEGTGNNWYENSKISGNYIVSNRSLGYSLALGNLEKTLVAGLPLYDTGSATDVGAVKIINEIFSTGYVGEIISTGNISYTSSYIATGNITGYYGNKTFLDSFNLLTGAYISGSPSNIIDFKANNKIQGNDFITTGFIDSGYNDIYIQVKSKNYPNTDQVTGKLTISGYSLYNQSNSVIIRYITGGN